ncbi:MAG: esterase-like activity of phytase family protein [Nostoc sp.]|uniref:esterase-like activity of phytase family protein n=1 Tax=Nostoc sp. TaxID=1180 RepID=UPI002FFA6EE3
MTNNATLVTTITIAASETDLFPLNGGTSSANTNRLGGFGSDLFYDYRQDVYYALVDRGPGGGVIDYQTRVEKFSITTDPTTGAITNYQLLGTIPFTIAAGTTLNGVTYAATTPFNGRNAKLLNSDGSVLGLSQDPEGFVVGKNGNFFVSDEYGPSIYEFNPAGVFVRAFTAPINIIAKVSGTPYYAGDDSPATTTGRQSNRGYEGLAISPDGTKLYAMLQDPLQEEGSGGSNPGRNSPNVRIIRYDVATGLSDAQYIYQLEALSDINARIPGTTNDFSASAQGRNIGISSLVAINNNELLVIERDNRGVGIDDPTGIKPIGSKRVFKINLTGATDVSTTNLAGTNTLPLGVTPVSKTLLLDIAEAIQGAGRTVPEKFEGLTIGPRLSDGTFALILATDNDFSVTQNGSNTQFDVYSNGVSTAQVAIGSAAPTAPAGEPAYTLLPSYLYSFKTQANTLNPTPVFDFSSANYSVIEGNAPGFTTNATVRVTRTGSIAGTDTVQLQLSDGTAKGIAVTPTQDTTQGPSSSATPYIIPVTSGSGVSLTSILSVGDSIGGYKMVGIPDGLGAFDNGDGTFTLLMNHEIGNTLGVTRAHGGKGAFVSSWVINKSNLSVVSGSDLIKNVYNWNAATQSSNTTTSTIDFSRFCSADLPSVTAYYNAATGLGSQERIFMHGEEGGATGYQLATIATGANKGNSYILGKFNLSTNNSGLTGVGGWENALANPLAQDKTIVIGNNDGGTGIMSNAVAVYVGTKQNTGTEIDKAGLTNGTLKFINVAGSTAEIVNTTTRATNITSGTAFTLSGTASTTFSRPEDGAWNPLNPSQYFFTTTDRIDQVADGIGTQVGRSRLWRLNFSDITNPDAGGTIDLLLDGTEGGNMFDNMTVDKYGHILLQEDVGNAAHNGKIWQYDIATDTLKLLAKHDPARFGDIGVAATTPFTQDEESSGIIDAQDILGPGWFLLDTQAHYAITGELVEGGQLQALFNPDTYNAYQADYNNTPDYNNIPITVTFNPGETFKDVPIPIAGDTNVENNETVNLTLVNPSSNSAVGTKQPNSLLTIQNNSAPTNVSLSATSVNENVTANTVVGTFTTTDPDTGNTFTYSLVAGIDDTDNAAFAIADNSLQVKASPDFEAKSSYSIRVRSTDNGGLSVDKVLAIQVNDLNEAPTDLALGVTTVDENVLANTVIGTFQTTDQDANNTFTYSLVAGIDDTDNAAFTINGYKLQINSSPNFDIKSSYKIRVKTTDQSGLSFEKALNVGVNNIVIPAQLTKGTDDVFNIKGDNGKGILKITIASSTPNANQLSELGVFNVDDAAGSVKDDTGKSLLPGANGYAKAALARAKVLFSTIANLPNGFSNNDVVRLLQLDFGSNLRFYLVQGTTTQTVISKNSYSDVVFSSTQNIKDLGNNGFSLNFQNLVVNIQSTNQSLDSGLSNQFGQQGSTKGEILYVNDKVNATFTVNSEAAYDNFIGFYQVTDETGSINVNGTIYKPGDSGYTQAAINSRVVGLTGTNQVTIKSNGKFSSNTMFAPFIIANGDPNTYISRGNPVYFSFLGANPTSDKQVDHIRLLGNNTFGFEDLPNGGDQDFNDLIVQVNLS